jgi:hypothetical protein
MTRLTASLGFFLVLAALAPAQDRSGADDERDDRLAMYLRTGRYADARRLIDEMLKTEYDLERNHQGLGNTLLASTPARTTGSIRRCSRLGGLLNPGWNKRSGWSSLLFAQGGGP